MSRTRQRFTWSRASEGEVPHGVKSTPNIALGGKFEMSPPMILSQCHPNSSHMLMIGVTDDYGKESNTEIIQVSQGEVVREHLDLKGIASHPSVAPLH